MKRLLLLLLVLCCAVSVFAAPHGNGHGGRQLDLFLDDAEEESVNESSINSSTLDQDALAGLVGGALETLLNTTNGSSNSTNISVNETEPEINTTMPNATVNTTGNTSTNTTTNTTINTTSNSTLNVSNTTNATGNLSNLTTNSTSNSTVLTNTSLNTSTNSTSAPLPSGSSSTLFAQIAIGTPGNFSLLETQTAKITTHLSGTVQWFVNDVPALTAPSSTVFLWTPGILSTSNSDTVVVRAVSGTGEERFTLTVRNVINPFWQDTLGSADATVKVFTNSDVAQWSNISVQLQSGSGESQVPMLLLYSGAAEAEWTAPLTDMAQGNTYIRSITAYDGSVEFIFPVNGSLAHYRQESTRASSRSSGGGGGGFKNERPAVLRKQQEQNASNAPPEFVYAVFAKDVLPINESVELSLDAKDNSKVVSVAATIVDEFGNGTSLDMELANGDQSYGTWKTIVHSFGPGKHRLAVVQITDDLNMTVSIPVDDVSFYVVSEAVLSGESLLLVYATLGSNVVEPGSSVSVRLDARDFSGVVSATAVFKSKDDELRVPLQLLAGDKSYGTWGANVTLETPDTTYALNSIILENGNESREIKVYGQKVYVNYVKSGNQLSGMAVSDGTGVKKILRHPFMPLFVGLAGMGIAMVVVSSMTFVKTE